MEKIGDMKTFIIVAILSGAVAGSLTTFLLNNVNHSQDRRIADFYATETAVMVSPHGLRKKMDKGDESFILVDLRSGEEYASEHIVGAVSIPAYADPNTSAYGDVERIVNSFRELEEKYPDREIIAYCYSIPCMTGRKIGNMLAEHGVYVKELGVGWNEWRHFWTLWNHELEWKKTNVLDYVVSGAEPGTPKIKENSKACPIEGEFGC